MNKPSIENYIVQSEYQQQTIVHILKQLIEYRSMVVDNKININLLNTLIESYSEQEKKLYELNLLKNKFLGMAAHDLRNPLAVMIGFSDLLLIEKEHFNEEHLEFISIIKDSSKKMLDLVNDLLDISAIESGKITLNCEQTSIESLLQDKVRLDQFIANHKKITIIEHYETNLPKINIDNDKIGQVVDNLLSNAIKFSHPGQKIHINCFKKSDYIVFSIQDEGVGIPEKEHSKLFQAFEKVSSKPTGGEKSTGLGLAIVKRIIDAHNGCIDVESSPDKGTKFIISIPLNEE